MLVTNHLFKNRVPLMSAALDAYSLRQSTIAKNIANINTPHYKPEIVKFEELLNDNDSVLKGKSSSNEHLRLGSKSQVNLESKVEHAPIAKAEIYHSGETHVNIDKEMSELARNQIMARFTTQMMSRYFRGLDSAITGQASRV